MNKLFNLEDVEMVRMHQPAKDTLAIGLATQLADTMRENERLKVLIDALLKVDYAEDCQECAIGRSSEWAKAKEYLNKHRDTPRTENATRAQQVKHPAIIQGEKTLREIHKAMQPIEDASKT